jgi:hypothetical protein
MATALLINGGVVEFEKELANFSSEQTALENQTCTYQIVLSNWNMGGTEYGSYSGSFSYPKRLKLNDLVYASVSFFSGKTIISAAAALSYPAPSLGYCAIEWIDLSGAKYYSLFAQTFSPNHYFNINTLTIRDSTNNWIYYQNRYSEGTTIQAPQGFNYSFSNWNSSGVESGGFGGSFTTPQPSTVEDLIVFRGRYSGGATIIHNAMAIYGYPVSAFGYLGILLRNQNNPNQFYLAIISQFVSSFSINSFWLVGNGFTHHQAPWNDAGHGTILNPSGSNLTNFEGAKNNPYIGNGNCILTINFVDNTSQQLTYATCPTVLLYEGLNCPNACDIANRIISLY